MGTFVATTALAKASATIVVPAQPKPHVVLTPPSAFDKLKPHWRGLADKALAANPFMAPEFIEAAAAHLAGRNELSLAAVYREHARSQELIGLFALAQPPARTFPFVRSARPTLWAHPLMTDGTPLLSQDIDDARSAVDALFDTLNVTRRGGLTLPSIAADSLVWPVLRDAAASRGLIPHLSTPDSHSHGLHMMPGDRTIRDDILVALEPAPLQALLEQAFAMDAATGRGQHFGDQKVLSFIRAAVRGFSHTRQVAIARLDNGQERAAALAWLSADHALVWRLFGPQGTQPKTEWALAQAIGRATGKTPVAATHAPVAGIGMEAYPTMTATFSFAH